MHVGSVPNRTVKQAALPVKLVTKLCSIFAQSEYLLLRESSFQSKKSWDSLLKEKTNWENFC